MTTTTSWAQRGQASAGAEQVQMLKLTGEVDLSNAHELVEAIAAAVDDGTRDFVVDLSDVSFLDAAALRALLRGRNGAARQNGRFALVRPPARVWRVFVVTGLSRVFPAFLSRDAARRYASAPRR